MNTESFKNDAIDAIDELFSNTKADEEDQIEALEEIVNRAEDAILVLKEQLRNSGR